jgi:hypothetical protein
MEAEPEAEEAAVAVAEVEAEDTTAIRSTARSQKTKTTNLNINLKRNYLKTSSKKTMTRVKVSKDPIRKLATDGESPTAGTTKSRGGQTTSAVDRGGPTVYKTTPHRRRTNQVYLL